MTTASDPLRGPLGDLDGDGKKNLWEYAVNTPANSADIAGLPVVEKLVNSGDGETYPVVSHRRRIVPGALQYFIERPPEVNVWSEPASGEIEQIGSAVPTGDGVAETVQFRLQPSLEDSASPRYLRGGVRFHSS